MAVTVSIVSLLSGESLASLTHCVVPLTVFLIMTALGIFAALRLAVRARFKNREREAKVDSASKQTVDPKSVFGLYYNSVLVGKLTFQGIETPWTLFDFEPTENFAQLEPLLQKCYEQLRNAPLEAIKAVKELQLTLKEMQGEPSTNTGIPTASGFWILINKERATINFNL